MIGFGIAWLDWTIWTIGFLNIATSAAVILWIWGQK